MTEALPPQTEQSPGSNTHTSVLLDDDYVLHDEDDDAYDSQQEEAAREREDRLQERQLLRFMGRPYLANSTNCCLSLVTTTASLLLGACLGLGAFFILESSHVLDHVLWTTPSSLAMPKWKGLLLAAARLSMGGLLSSICLWCLPWSPRNRICHFYHDLISLDPLPRESNNSIQTNLVMIVAAWVILLVGSPLGPEMALGALASLLVKLLLLTHTRNSMLFEWSVPSNTTKRQRRRTGSILVQSSIAGALTCLLPSPLLGLLAVQELVLSARPHDTTIDAVILEEQKQQRRHTHGVQDDNDDGDEDGESNASSDDDPMQVPLLPTRPSMLPRQTRLSSLDHDYMEVLFFSICTAVTTFLVLKELSAVSRAGFYTTWLEEFQAVFQPHRPTNPKDYLLAIPLGMLGGIMGLVMLSLTAIGRWIRCRASRWLHQQCRQPVWLGPVAASTLAGTLVAGLTLLVPAPWMITNNGVQLSLVLLQQQQHQQEKEDLLSEITIDRLLILVGCRMASLIVLLGFGGWFGGPVFPLASIGVCLGLVVAKAFAFIPLSLAVPCCIAAVLGAAVPLPFTIAVALIQIFALDLDQAGPVLVAGVVAHGVTGGSGCIRYLGQRLIGIRRDYTSDEEEEEELAEQLLMAPSDDDMLREIRSAIFGGLT